ncbi:hypothetical protein [Flavobacterium branchiophilum]|uniref:YhhN-like protein n=1 Tax=Flavobacterium branchiophilum TaxID=55197 RepID=A0A2H3K9F5_9FLAO|nr:hypothetical protein [Flavobacterium branchiophilum]PDS22769.1 hypothetical protein B0A77_12695 [Flavobacterium branchiophilum]
MNSLKKYLTFNNIRIAYFTLVFLDIICEANDVFFFKYFFKLLIAPTLLIFYYRFSNETSMVYILSIISMFICNILFLEGTKKYYFLAMCFNSLMYLLFLVYTYQHIKFKFSWLSIKIVIGFLSLNLIFLFLMGFHISLKLLPILNLMIFSSVLGSLVLPHYFTNENKAITLLVIAFSFSVVNVFIILINNFYLSLFIFEPLEFIVFTTQNFFFCWSFITINKLNAN